MTGKKSARVLLPAFLLGLCLSGPVGEARAAASPPPQPQILEAAQAPKAARILRRVALTYAPRMSPAERDRDGLQKIAQAKRLLGVGRLVELRHQTLALNPPGIEVLLGEPAVAALAGRRPGGGHPERAGLGAGPGPETSDLRRL